MVSDLKTFAQKGCKIDVTKWVEKFFDRVKGCFRIQKGSTSNTQDKWTILCIIEVSLFSSFSGDLRAQESEMDN